MITINYTAVYSTTVGRYTQYNSSLYLLARQVEAAVRNIADCDLATQVNRNEYIFQYSVHFPAPDVR